MSAGGGGESIDLSPSVPSNAQAIANRKPDIRQAYDTVQASSGNISGQIESASSSNAVLDLGSGTYTMSSGVSLGGNVAGIIGDGPEAATINISGSHGYLFSFSGDTFIMEGVTVDISGGDTDAGLASVRYSNECWCEDVTLRGRRDKYAHSGPRMTFIIKGTQSSAEGYMHRCRFPDGGTNHSGRNTVGHAIGPNSDPGHHGTNVWHECLAANFQDNGFYVAYAEGANILWNCVARNNSGANMRISTGDYIVGGSSEATSTPSGRQCKCLTVDHVGAVKVVGLKLYGTGDAVGGGAQLIQIRGDSEDVTLERTVAHNNGGNFLARLDVADVQIDGGWWYQENQSSTAVQVGVRSGNADVNVTGDWRVQADGATEISGPITINGTNYSGSTSASEAGLGNPQPFPEFHFSGAPSGVGEWTSDGGGGGGGGGGTGGGGAGGGGGGGSVAGWQNLGAGSGTAVLDTGACGEITVDVDPSFWAPLSGAGGMGVAGWDNIGDDEGVPVRTNFDGMGSIGGGDDYTGGVSQSEADMVVGSAQELQTAASNASSGDVVFIPGSAGPVEVSSPVEFSSNEVTLASDRGTDGSAGATLRIPTTSESEGQASAVRLIGDAARVTGLTIEGPENGAGTDPTEAPHATGVWLDGGGCEVDNCEIRNFPSSGVMIQARTAAVHHNTIRNVAQAVRAEQSSGMGGSGEADCSPATQGGQ